jgi:uncharacterized protein (DUF1501 family)
MSDVTTASQHSDSAEGIPAFGASSGCPDGCPEYGGISRRGVLRGMVAAGAVTTMFGRTFTQTSFAATRPSAHTLVVLSLRGAADGLSLVVPHGDPAYYQARPRIAVPSAALLAKDGFFGLHPALAPLLPLWKAGKMAAVHATGLPVPNRSHFAAMEAVEDADPGSSARVGWINRVIGADSYTNPLQAIGMGMSSPITALYGPQRTVTTSGIDAMVINGSDDAGRTRSLNTLWSGATGILGKGGRAALTAVRDFRPVHSVRETPANGAVYPDSHLGQALAHSARTIRADIGADVIAVDHDGDWDMHQGVGTLDSGKMRLSAKDLAEALTAFFVDLGTLGDKVTVVTLSEFGRRVRENANQGLDHGHGNVMFVLGGGVKGGYRGRWPGLGTGADDDLAVTTDYRSVLAEVVTRRLGVSAATAFPRFAPQAVGVML